MDSAELLDAIRQMVAERTNAPLESISSQSRLSSDLGITGDDAYELLEAFCERFNVKFDGFVFLDHFEWEGWDLTTPLFIGFMSIVSPRFAYLWEMAKSREREITIQHLADCAAAGHWIPSSVRKSSPSKYATVFSTAFRTICILVGAALLLCAVAGAVFGLAITLNNGNTRGVLLGLVCSLGCVLFLLLMARMTKHYLRSKEVWERLSPVAE